MILYSFYLVFFTSRSQLGGILGEVRRKSGKPNSKRKTINGVKQASFSLPFFKGNDQTVGSVGPLGLLFLVGGQA